MSDLRELYQELILDHSKHPRNKGEIEHANHSAEGYNPLCGDQVTVQLAVNDDNIVTDAAFDGAGCAISTASASLMTEAIKGMSVEKATLLFNAFHSLVTGKEVPPDSPDLDKLEVFAGVVEFPMRVKCASLSWHTFQAAIDGSNDSITTE
ncbi:MAG TPA: SUF system NifU family Fe-S cluster assembly protein [Myxococcales bacterium]|nr:SUF system NifU family Fe-S cluster assembly protein [Myxococcales bacterium]HIN86187.1 SUF system NifU family Fe-S cluster assembly protein [Myxococcales bacterium]